MTREKVIEGLEYLITAYAFHCDDAECLGKAVELLKEQETKLLDADEIIMSLSEIADQPTEDGMVDGVCQQTIRDALELINYQHEHIEAFLRDQEPIAPRRIDGKKNHFIKCGNCNIDLMTGYIFCPKCGRRLKWDE